MYHEGTNMHPLGTKVYLMKRYRPSDSFRTFFSESVEIHKSKKKGTNFFECSSISQLNVGRI